MIPTTAVADGGSTRPTNPAKNLVQQPCQIIKYLMDFRTTLDAQHFQLMPTSTHHQVKVRHGTTRLTATGAWAKRWAHWVGRGVLT